MINREEVWLKAWCAVANAWNCQDYGAANRWADSCLKSFEELFHCRVIEEPEEIFGEMIPVSVTSCCRKGPITDENYCPNCGKKIEKAQ